MIKTFVFDFGGVIITIDPVAPKEKFRAMGLKNVERYLNTYAQQGLFGELEKGNISAGEFIKGISELAGREVTYDECADAWLSFHKELPERNLEALLELGRQGYRTVLLSNTNPFMMNWADSNDFDGKGHPIGYYFDAMYRSFELKLMKPHKEIFQYVLEKEQIKPEETLFLDDGKANIESASSLGIHTMLVDNGVDWIKELGQYLE